MLRLAVEDEPAVVLLQELPVAALSRLERWTGYQALGVVAARARLPAELAYRITERRPQFRSSLEGQANAILVARGRSVRDHTQLVLNQRRYRQRESLRLELPFAARLAWALERRVVHSVRVSLSGSRTMLVANLHATSYRLDKRLADAELLRAATYADGLARPDEALVLGGDFNVTVVSSPTLRRLATAEWGFSPAGPGLDHVLVRGLEIEEPETPWPADRREHDGKLMSDHSPVDVTIR